MTVARKDGGLSVRVAVEMSRRVCVKIVPNIVPPVAALRESIAIGTSEKERQSGTT